MSGLTLAKDGGEDPLEDVEGVGGDLEWPLPMPTPPSGPWCWEYGS